MNNVNKQNEKSLSIREGICFFTFTPRFTGFRFAHKAIEVVKVFSCFFNSLYMFIADVGIELYADLLPAIYIHVTCFTSTIKAGGSNV
jgi:hypothetical protein